MMGKVVAQIIAGCTPEIDLEPYSPTRFERG